MLFAGKAFFLGGGYDFAISHKSRSTVVIIGGNAQDEVAHSICRLGIVCIFYMITFLVR